MSPGLSIEWGYWQALAESYVDEGLKETGLCLIYKWEMRSRQKRKRLRLHFESKTPVEQPSPEVCSPPVYVLIRAVGMARACQLAPPQEFVLENKAAQFFPTLRQYVTKLVRLCSSQVCTIEHLSRFNCDNLLKTVAPTGRNP
jgi:hypothetical protein